MAHNGRLSRWSLLAACLGFMPHAVSIVHAQSSDTGTLRAGIKVAPVIMAEPDVETLLAIQVGPEPAVPRQTFLRIRGMPLAAKLSDGHVVTPGIWAVPLTALPSLRLLAPLASSGRTEIHFALVGVDGGVLAETKSSLVVAPAWLLGSGGAKQDPQRAPGSARDMAAQTAPSADTAAAPSQVELQKTVSAQALVPAPVAPPPQPVARPEPPAVVAALPPAAPAAAPPAARTAPAVAPPATSPVQTAPSVAPAPKAATVLTTADRERAESLLQRGEAYMRQGNLAAARQFYRRAADIGLAAGALRMGATYDPMEMAGLGMVGVQPDLKEAAQWYERARELGATEAVARLARIQNR